ncbi:hypothetical protein [Amycolatopsis sp. DSM 110486]|uniref:hypothetical protein n=1 Tax=Amycolatopsis sp. DSM 110486 TaxID=2865832 RepID=UPI001C69E3BF|nr:hypothetical protein [Amycolatopsis sp. DSM 110486]QYN26698.1 hypothetical protein K1T34_52955 [Amycolatopsis sp. DSM 110486]
MTRPNEERFRVGQKLRSNLFGTVWEIVADHHYPPEYVELVPEVASHRYYVVRVNGEDSVMEHGVIASACTPIPDEEPNP